MQNYSEAVPPAICKNLFPDVKDSVCRAKAPSSVFFLLGQSLLPNLMLLDSIKSLLS